MHLIALDDEMVVTWATVKGDKVDDIGAWYGESKDDLTTEAKAEWSYFEKDNLHTYRAIMRPLKPNQKYC